MLLEYSTVYLHTVVNDKYQSCYNPSSCTASVSVAVSSSIFGAAVEVTYAVKNDNHE